MTAAENNFLLQGDAAPLPMATPLRAASLTLTYGNGELHDLRIGSTGAEYVDGSRAAAAFPRLITFVQPVPGFRDLRALVHEISPGVRIRIQFAGDSFEPEGQRQGTGCRP